MNNETQSINDLAVESLEGDKTIDLNKDVDYKIASSIDEEIKKELDNLHAKTDALANFLHNRIAILEDKNKNIFARIYNKAKAFFKKILAVRISIKQDTV